MEPKMFRIIREHPEQSGMEDREKSRRVGNIREQSRQLKWESSGMFENISNVRERSGTFENIEKFENSRNVRERSGTVENIPNDREQSRKEVRVVRLRGGVEWCMLLP